MMDTNGLQNGSASSTAEGYQNLQKENKLLVAANADLKAATEQASQHHTHVQEHLHQTISQMQTKYAHDRSNLEAQIEQIRTQYNTAISAQTSREILQRHAKEKRNLESKINELKRNNAQEQEELRQKIQHLQNLGTGVKDKKLVEWFQAQIHQLQGRHNQVTNVLQAEKKEVAKLREAVAYMKGQMAATSSPNGNLLAVHQFDEAMSRAMQGQRELTTQTVAQTISGLEWKLNDLGDMTAMQVPEMNVSNETHGA